MDLPVFLEGFNEHAGLQETIFRILPARQCLKAAQAAGCRGDNGLIINLYEVRTEGGINIVNYILLYPGFLGQLLIIFIKLLCISGPVQCISKT